MATDTDPMTDHESTVEWSMEKLLAQTRALSTVSVMATERASMAAHESTVKWSMEIRLRAARKGTRLETSKASMPPTASQAGWVVVRRGARFAMPGKKLKVSTANRRKNGTTGKIGKRTVKREGGAGGSEGQKEASA